MKPFKASQKKCEHKFEGHFLFFQDQVGIGLTQDT